MKKKIYIAGKVTGLPENEVKTKFAYMQNQIEKNGFTPVNPVQLVQTHLNDKYRLIKLSEHEIWKIAMKVCIKELVDCDAVVFLEDWHTSKGAKIELKLALDLGLTIYYGRLPIVY